MYLLRGPSEISVGLGGLGGAERSTQSFQKHRAWAHRRHILELDYKHVAPLNMP